MLMLCIFQGKSATEKQLGEQDARLVINDCA